jgi:hypothetical protein
VLLHVWTVPTSGALPAMARLATDRVALRGYPGLTFAKLLGTGSGRTFAPQDADPRHWALLTCWDAPHAAARRPSTAIAAPSLRSGPVIDGSSLLSRPSSGRGSASRPASAGR